MILRRSTRRCITGSLLILIGFGILFLFSQQSLRLENIHDRSNHHKLSDVAQVKRGNERHSESNVDVHQRALEKIKINQVESVIKVGAAENEKKFESLKKESISNKVIEEIDENPPLNKQPEIVYEKLPVVKDMQNDLKIHEVNRHDTGIKLYKEEPLVSVKDDTLQTTEKPFKKAEYKITSGFVEYIPGEKGAFHIVQNFLLYIDPDFTEPVNASQSKRAKKQNELEQTLQSNLNHPVINRIHIMYSHKPLFQYLQKLNLTNRHKLITVYFEDTPKISDFLQYIEDKLQNRYVIVNNQDIEIGEEWDAIDLGKFREQRIMYAISRNVKAHHMADKNCYASYTANCNPGQPDYGSADLFAFYNEGKVPPAMMKEMSYTQAKYGMENVFMWYAKFEWHYNLFNPCKVLKIYHVDCYHIDKKGRDRQKRNDHVLTVPFTNQLYLNF
ncbi:uncharacterized protein [Clytia hemisphaerica]|uniref:Uncharacterized protein n=1 Tax=Clytia hemisphaerica TaxID=252671 RepID=A0A7M5USI1_9CNID